MCFGLPNHLGWASISRLGGVRNKGAPSDERASVLRIMVAAVKGMRHRQDSVGKGPKCCWRPTVCDG